MASSHLCPAQQLEQCPVPVLPFTLIQVGLPECRWGPLALSFHGVL